MSLSPSEVRKIAHLARLSIADAEIEPLTQNLDNILELVNKMNRINGDQAAPLAHPLETTQPLRNDVVSENNQRELFLQNAPQSMMGLFIVPQVLETGE
jgi:aspartyl-tRNA(Asn)/glutamyl-tRNA(Gln) amidotransferase subunit C